MGDPAKTHPTDGLSRFNVVVVSPQGSHRSNGQSTDRIVPDDVLKKTLTKLSPMIRAMVELRRPPRCDRAR